MVNFTERDIADQGLGERLPDRRDAQNCPKGPYGISRNSKFRDEQLQRSLGKQGGLRKQTINLRSAGFGVSPAMYTGGGRDSVVRGLICSYQTLGQQRAYCMGENVIGIHIEDGVTDADRKWGK